MTTTIKRKPGRPNEHKVKVCWLIAPDVLEYLRTCKRPISRVVEDAVRIHMEKGIEDVDTSNGY